MILYVLVAGEGDGVPDIEDESRMPVFEPGGVMMMLALEGKRLLEEILEEAVMTELGEKVPTPGVNSPVEGLFLEDKTVLRLIMNCWPSAVRIIWF